MRSVLENRFVEIEQLSRKLGLDFFDVVFEEVPREVIWDVASYGLPTRMSHWSFGRSFLHQKTYGEMGLSKIYELVINNDPAYAFLDDTNPDVTNLLIAAHVFAHVDFFKNNQCFSGTNRNMVNQAEMNAKTIDSYREKYGIDEVEKWMDVAFSIDRHLDHNLGENREKYPLPEHTFKKIDPLPFADLFGEEEKPHVVEEVKNNALPPHPERDLIWFLTNYGKMLPWQRDVFEIIRSEAFYFYPQGQTKVINEGWACVGPNTLVFTRNGICSMRDVVENKIKAVYDGNSFRRIYDTHIIHDHPTIRITTRRGFCFTGATTHRILLSDGHTFCRLDELKPGDTLQVSSGMNSWPSRKIPISWKLRDKFSLTDAAVMAGVSIDTIRRRRAGRKVEKIVEVDNAIKKYENNLPAYGITKRRKVTIPTLLDEKLAQFLGYLIGDGNISRTGRSICLTSKDKPQVEDFKILASEIFGVPVFIKKDENRYRSIFYSETVSDFLVEAIGLTTGPSARRKTIPDLIMKSPESVVRAFLRAYFDCDGYAGESGVILSTSSTSLAERTQVLLLNWNILSRINKQPKQILNLNIKGKSSEKFMNFVGFGLKRKQDRLRKYVKNRQWFCREKWYDEVVLLELGTGDVYDISVDKTHCYSAAGLIHHNSFWHAEIMYHYDNLSADEHMQFSKSHSSIVSKGSPGQVNPYYMGFRIFSDIKKRWDDAFEEGKKDNAFHKLPTMDMYDEDDKLVASKMTGLQKIMKVRREETDYGFICNYLTRELATDMDLFTYGLAGVWPKEEDDNIILKSRKLEKIKARLTAGLHNNGVPFITIDKVENNVLWLLHSENKMLDQRYAKETVRYIGKAWGGQVNLKTYKGSEPITISITPDGNDIKVGETKKIKIDI